MDRFLCVRTATERSTMEILQSAEKPSADPSVGNSSKNSKSFQSLSFECFSVIRMCDLD